MNEIRFYFLHRQKHKKSLTDKRMRNNQAFGTDNFIVEEKYVDVHCASFVTIARTGALKFCFDLESRGKYWKQVIETGLYTVNELRREENKPDVEGGDTVLVSANLKSITNLSAEGEPTQTEPDKNPDDNKKKEDSEDEE